MLRFISVETNRWRTTRRNTVSQPGGGNVEIRHTSVALPTVCQRLFCRLQKPTFLSGWCPSAFGFLIKLDQQIGYNSPRKGSMEVLFQIHPSIHPSSHKFIHAFIHKFIHSFFYHPQRAFPVVSAVGNTETSKVWLLF